MKRTLLPLLLVLPVLVLSASVAASAEQLIPAGSVMQCRVSDKISSKTTNVGDPILCMVSHSEKYGRAVFPYGAYLVGHFEEYKDPGHFVGKGWMELRFDRMVMGNDTQVSINARVVATSQKNGVDKEGRILGTGHPVKDTVEWLIPVLWPLDLINLPRRGPTPVIKPETQLTLKLMDDVGLPTKQEVQHQPELVSRFNYSDPTPTGAEQEQQRPAPIEHAYAQPAPVQYQQPAPVQQAYAQQPSPTTVVVVQAPQQQQPQPVYIQQQPAPQIVMQQPPVVYNEYHYPAPIAYGYPPVAYRYPAPYPGSYYRPY